MKKLAKVGIALAAVGILSFGDVTGSTSSVVEAKSMTSDTLHHAGSTSFGSDWKSGRVGFWGGCALSGWLGTFECHESQLPW
ncbi:hypothetical protein QRD89_02725 [Halobacillus sp. ACCC02827]|uniref:hypothetical protein n=1 Tax=Bacillaceae TaxID=186817 RepID=UPI0002A50975|nr:MULTISPECIES: hypothetical protein [Bacillaceae]ELK46575.1 hypothetical protein D479_09951 [Halobacillus sp. BAB-2008]QHT45487.1 hypothetical protein M662_02815 [Bacillus sp. SB49]WJE16285.1 hypothetical protein QRD89_02725 [Halobacillus sp. ACCC02827]